METIGDQQPYDPITEELHLTFAEVQQTSKISTLKKKKRKNATGKRRFGNQLRSAPDAHGS